MAVLPLNRRTLTPLLAAARQAIGRQSPNERIGLFCPVRHLVDVTSAGLLCGAGRPAEHPTTMYGLRDVRCNQ